MLLPHRRTPILPNYLNRQTKHSHLENTNHRSIQLDGVLIRGNRNTPVNIEFTVLPNGKPVLKCSAIAQPLLGTVSYGTSHGYSRFKKYSVKSNTASRYLLWAYPVHIYGKGYNSRTGLSTFRISPSKVQVRDISKRAKPPYKIVFALSNFYFLGLGFSISNQTRISTRDRFDVHLNSGIYTFIQDPRIEEIELFQQTTFRPRITNWVEHEIQTKSEINSVISTIENICDMLSIVCNQNINWGFWRLYDSTGRLVSEEYQDRHQGEYKLNNEQSIDNFRIFGGLKDYLETCHDNYARLKTTHKLQKFKGFINSIPTISSVETSLLHLIPGLELISNMIISNSSDPRLSRFVSTLTSMDIEQKLNVLYSNYFKYFAIKKWRGIRRNIVHHIRNPLFHSGLITTPINITYGKTRYLHLIGIQLYLHLIGYKGKYIDFTAMYRRNQRIRKM